MARTRVEKYPTTDVFQYYNRNPRNRITTDCVIRAISLSLDLPYTTVVMEMAEMQCKTGYDDASKELIDRYLKSKGWVKCKQPRKGDNTKYTGEELNLPDCDWHRIVANIGGHHIVSIVEGKIHDIWDPSHKCVGNIWVKPI